MSTNELASTSSLHKAMEYSLLYTSPRIGKQTTLPPGKKTVGTWSIFPVEEHLREQHFSMCTQSNASGLGSHLFDLLYFTVQAR